MSLNRQQKLFFTFALLHALNIFSAVMNPFFTQWGGLSLSQITILQSWFTFSIFLLEVPTGVVADVFGRKLSIILGAWISFVSFLAYPQIANFAWFMLWEFALALSFSLISGADQALIHDSARSESESKKTY